MKRGQCIGRGRTADVYEWGHNEVLKLFKDGCYNEDEVKNSIIINNLGIPSPYVVGIVEIENRNIYERIKGKTMMQSINEVESSLSKYAGIMAELHHLSIAKNWIWNLI
jgi:tRNA A-37 threonylcarbamoyl transferase component Bud32